MRSTALLISLVALAALPAPAGAAPIVLGSPESLPAGNGPMGVDTGDLNGDHFPDLAVANIDGSTTEILLSDGAGGFAPAPGSPFATQGVWDAQIADATDDGNPDVVVLEAGSGSHVRVIEGDGQGGFTRQPSSS
jgi:VCBS repeat protein